MFLSVYHIKIECVALDKNSVDVLSKLPVNTAIKKKPGVLYLSLINEIEIMNAELVQKETIKDQVLFTRFRFR